VYTHSSSGDSSEWNNVTGLRIPDSDTSYMVTVMAEGYRLCGGYFKAGPHEAAVTVDMVCQKHPLPLGTIRMFIFHDIARKCYCGWFCVHVGRSTLDITHNFTTIISRRRKL